MQFYRDLEKRKESVRNYIRNNPKATSRDIRRNLRTKINKVYSRGMEEAYEDAEISRPRTLKHKSIEERRRILINYIKDNPKAGGHKIAKDTKINILSVFNNTREAFEAAGIKYKNERFRNLKIRSFKERREKMVSLIKEEPSLSIKEIANLSKISFYNHYGSIGELYNEAEMPYPGKGWKRKTKKQKMVLEFIKNKPFVTQREINRTCKTHVQDLFINGIFEAYKKAGVDYPYIRLDLHGSAVKEIKDEAASFEEKIAKIISRYGLVNRLVKTKRGFADIIFERINKKAVIEIKNYKSHEISISQIKQLNKYLEDTGSNMGFLICLKKPKKDTFLMGKNKIIVLDEWELNKIPQIMDL